MIQKLKVSYSALQRYVFFKKRIHWFSLNIDLNTYFMYTFSLKVNCDPLQAKNHIFENCLWELEKSESRPQVWNLKLSRRLKLLPGGMETDRRQQRTDSYQLKNFA